MHRSSCRAITGCLSSTSIPLLHVKALLPPLRVTLTHQSLSLKDLRIPLAFSLASLANFNPCTRLKKGSWRSFSQSHNLTPNLHLAREPLFLYPLNLPGLPFLLTPSHSNSFSHALLMTPSLRNTTATSHLSSLPHSDIIVWTDGLVPGGLRQGGAEIHIKYTKCVIATSLSFLTGLWATSYIYAILHAVEWCIFYSKTCAFESITLFSNCLSVLSTLSAPLPYIIPKSLSDTQSLLNVLSESKVVHFEWMPGHSSLLGNDLANSFAKVGASLDPLQDIKVFLTSYFLTQTVDAADSGSRESLSSTGSTHSLDHTLFNNRILRIIKFIVKLRFQARGLLNNYMIRFRLQNNK